VLIIFCEEIQEKIFFPKVVQKSQSNSANHFLWGNTRKNFFPKVVQKSQSYSANHFLWGDTRNFFFSKSSAKVTNWERWTLFVRYKNFHFFAHGEPHGEPHGAPWRTPWSPMENPMEFGGLRGQNFSFLHQDTLGRKMVYMGPRGPYLLVLEMF
jgi:hypothetical protein